MQKRRPQVLTAQLEEVAKSDNSNQSNRSQPRDNRKRLKTDPALAKGSSTALPLSNQSPLESQPQQKSAEALRRETLSEAQELKSVGVSSGGDSGDSEQLTKAGLANYVNHQLNLKHKRALKSKNKALELSQPPVMNSDPPPGELVGADMGKPTQYLPDPQPASEVFLESTGVTSQPKLPAVQATILPHPAFETDLHADQQNRKGVSYSLIQDPTSQKMLISKDLLPLPGQTFQAHSNSEMANMMLQHDDEAKRRQDNQEGLEKLKNLAEWLTLRQCQLSSNLRSRLLMHICGQIDQQPAKPKRQFGEANGDHQPQCFNRHCVYKSIPGLQIRQIKLPTGNKVNFCERCAKLYQKNFYCDYCFQVYADSDECDGKTWIQCLKCSKWNHPECEIQQDGKRVADLPEAVESMLQGNQDYYCVACRKHKKLAVATPQSKRPQRTQKPKVPSVQSSDNGGRPFPMDEETKDEKK